MGNFQHLAEKVLAKNSSKNREVSSFSPLAKETGNFQGKTGNYSGNYNETSLNTIQYRINNHEETDNETGRKVEPINEETFTIKSKEKSFLFCKHVPDIVEQFFLYSVNIGMNLLPDDKHWIKAITFGINASKLTVLLSKYIDIWC